MGGHQDSPMLQEQTGSRITAFRNAVTGAGRCQDGEPSTYLFEHHFTCWHFQLLCGANAGPGASITAVKEGIEAGPAWSSEQWACCMEPRSLCAEAPAVVIGKDFFQDSTLGLQNELVFCSIEYIKSHWDPWEHIAKLSPPCPALHWQGGAADHGLRIWSCSTWSGTPSTCWFAVTVEDEQDMFGDFKWQHMSSYAGSVASLALCFRSLD